MLRLTGLKAVESKLYLESENVRTERLSFPGEILRDGVEAAHWGLVQQVHLQLKRNCPQGARYGEDTATGGRCEEATPTQGQV